MHHRVPVRSATLVLVAAVAAACAKKQEQATVLAAPPTVRIVAADYGFSAPDTIPAGIVNVRLVNNGPSVHHVQFMQLGEGKTVGDLMAALRNPGPPPAWAKFVPGPNTPAPGDSTALVTDLPAGTYAMLCLIPDSAGMPHFAHGMVRGVVAVAGSGSAAVEPATDIEVALTEYAFTTTTDITAGTHTVRIVNRGSQPHELLLARLDSGVTVEQLIRWVDGGMHGRPPGVPLGGTSGMVPGAHADLTFDFTPGDYAFICFFPDANDGREHAQHGMFKQFHVS